MKWPLENTHPLKNERRVCSVFSVMAVMEDLVAETCRTIRQSLGAVLGHDGEDDHMLLSKMGEFTELEKCPQQTPLELEILESIQQSGSNLKFRKATWFCHRFGVSERVPVEVYEITDGIFRASFELTPFRSGYQCHVTMVSAPEEQQGSYFKFREFLIDKFAKQTLFACTRSRVLRIWGRALPSNYPVKDSPHKNGDWRRALTQDGENRLVRLYQRMGALKVLGEAHNTVCFYSPCALELLRGLDPAGWNVVSKNIARYERKRVPPKTNSKSEAAHTFFTNSTASLASSDEIKQ